MSWAEALANKKAQLKKTETVDKGGNAAEQLQTLLENKKIAEKTNVEKWYEPLKEFLIPCMSLCISLVSLFCLILIC
jgi:hypothetical protein